ncbi:MAG: DUF1064 domain-containing protein [Burkholderia gladioli]
MSKRSGGIRFSEDAIKDGALGTATVSKPWPTMTTPQRRIYETTGNPPQSSALDDPLDAFAGAAKKQPKYRNTKCEHDGIKFDSLKERSRWFHLIQLRAAGAIRDLEMQVPFVLIERAKRDDGTWEKATKYVADFVYVDVATGKKVVEDVKSPATRKNPAYVLKRKLMLDRHGITIKEQ